MGLSQVTLALYRRPVQEKVRVSTVFWRAFDKALKRKPPAVAADAGLCKFNCGKIRCSAAPGLREREPSGRD